MKLVSIALAAAGLFALVTMGVATSAQVVGDAPAPEAHHSVHGPAGVLPGGFSAGVIGQ